MCVVCVVVVAWLGWLISLFVGVALSMNFAMFTIVVAAGWVCGYCGMVVCAGLLCCARCYGALV